MRINPRIPHGKRAAAEICREKERRLRGSSRWRISGLRCGEGENDCGSAHNTDSGTHGFTTHIRHSYTEGYAYAEGYAYGFTTHIRHSLAHGVA